MQVTDSTTGVKPAPLIATLRVAVLLSRHIWGRSGHGHTASRQNQRCTGSGGGADPQDRTYAPHQACALTGGTATVVAGTDPGVVRVAVAPIVIAEVAGWT